MSESVEVNIYPEHQAVQKLGHSNNQSDPFNDVQIPHRRYETVDTTL